MVKKMMLGAASAGLLSGLIAVPAMAQDNRSSETTQTDPNANTVTIGVGVGVIPRYDGADDYYLTPIGGARGKLGGVGFSIIGLTAFTDFVPATAMTGGKFVFGPMAHLTLNRSDLRRNRDGRIAALGTIKPAVEVGVHAGYEWTGVITSDYDVLSLDVAVSHDVTSIHKSYVVSPSISYGTPLSKRIFVGLTISADYVGGDYARTYYGITPAQSAASGFPVYTLGEGFNSANAGLIAGYSLSGDLRRGFTLFAAGNYSRLLGETARSPVVRDKNQLIGAVGIAYTF
jgi:outer membrane protein